MNKVAHSLKYRPDIDGLRALAVLAVVFFHGGSQLFSGGFVGVDIFFVISGYLITAIIYKEVSEGSFSYRNFWLKRIRRIFPASIVSVFFSIIIFGFLLSPSDFIIFGKSLVGLGLFSSNIFFWRESGYFSPNAEEFPLLHTWSLAVEEQFYFFLPLFLLFFVKRGKRTLIGAVLFVVIISFIVSIWLTERSPSAAFYLLPARAWELGLGSLLALLPNSNGKKFSPILEHFLGFVSICFMVVPIFIFDKKTPFPSYNAFYPVFGAVLYIWLPHNAKGIKYFFSRRISLYLGKISYSFYLWHWIVFTAFKHISFHHPTSTDFIIGGVISFVLASLSYHFVEQPFRLNTQFWDPFKLWTLLIGSTVGFLAIGVFIYTSKGLSQRFGDSFVDYRESSPIFNFKELCRNEDNGICNGDFKSGHFVWGDSHAKANLAAFKDKEVSFALKEGCPPLLKVFMSGKSKVWNKQCQDHNRKVLAHLRDFNGKIHLIFRYDIYFNNRRKFERTFMKERYLFDPKGPGVKVLDKKNSLFNLKRSLTNTISALTGKDVIIWRQVPAFAIHPAYYGNKTQILGTGLSWTENEVDLSRRVLSLESFIKSKEWSFLDTWGPICNEGKCSPFVKTNEAIISLYYDDDHLSEVGSLRLSHLP